MSKYILDFEAPLRVLEEKIESLHSTAMKTGVDVTSGIKQLEAELVTKKQAIYENLSRWERVQLARHPKRPYSSDYIERVTEDWIELHGDRYFSDDTAIIGGIGKIGVQSFIIIGQEKGRGTKNKLYRNFGMPRPEGYRKALRLMKMAEKFKIPVLTIIDTIGAYPGLGAEERGQAEAIARNLFEMARLQTPIISIVVGEGASGGALGIGVADRLLCFENTWFSVISPEGCASILFRDATRAPEAADSMKVTAQDLFDFGIADKIISEPNGGAHLDYDAAAVIFKDIVLEEYDLLKHKTNEELIESRMIKFEKMGRWEELSE
ncbi:MAG: acetyl-CoA carboxylase carboxyltransferase subunit alpha [Candidatus Marinimicrobia bacterium]|nr:acetyl-CoA carboxylase carboxyltransferase subunit alpha [Candidatus Neomarinimicrobiota bacterium]MBT6870859.1 acetyl-CoA carboxylase carboxyltransferase subunit alpha [Candidatus Neomarinimicrobiota bacterium]